MKKSNRLRVMILGWLLLFSACASRQLPVDSVLLTDSITFALLPPDSFGQSISLTQAAYFKVNQQQHELLFQTEITPQTIQVIGMLPSGTRLFSLSFDGEKIESSGYHQALNKLKPIYLLAELQLSLWPEKILAAQLSEHNPCFRSGDCRLLQDANGNRDITVEGDKRIRIRYDRQPRWRAVIEFTHAQRGYQYRLEPLAVEPLSDQKLSKQPE